MGEFGEFRSSHHADEFSNEAYGGSKLMTQGSRERKECGQICNFTHVVGEIDKFTHLQNIFTHENPQAKTLWRDPAMTTTSLARPVTTLV